MRWSNRSFTCSTTGGPHRPSHWGSTGGAPSSCRSPQLLTGFPFSNSIHPWQKQSRCHGSLFCKPINKYKYIHVYTVYLQKKIYKYKCIYINTYVYKYIQINQVYMSSKNSPLRELKQSIAGVSQKGPNKYQCMYKQSLETCNTH